MSEKRFIWKCDDETCHIFDTVTKARYFYEGIMNLLNEQQATISTMTEENKELGKNFEDLVDWASKIANRNVVLDEQIGQLQRENEQLRQQLKEKEDDEQLYANEIVKLNKEAKEVLDFKSLGGDY